MCKLSEHVTKGHEGEMAHVQICDDVDCGGPTRMVMALSSHKESMLKKI